MCQVARVISDGVGAVRWLRDGAAGASAVGGCALSLDGGRGDRGWSSDLTSSTGVL
jgi:hypothetical protein